MILAAALAALLASTDSMRGPVRNRTFDEAVPVQSARDAWLGEDKFRHFAMSYAITGFAFAGARVVFGDDTSLGLAIAAGSTAGLLKEFYDRSRGRPFSKRDLVWDAAGVAVGAIMVRQTWN